MTIRIKDINSFILSICLFFYIFDPPLIKGVSFVQLSLLVALAYIVIRYKTFVKLFKDSNMFSFLKKILMYVLYCFLLNIIYFLVRQGKPSIADKNISDAISVITTYSMLILPVLAILVFCVFHKLNIDNVIEILTVTFMIQFVFVILAFLFPSMKNTFVNLIYQNTRNDNIQAIVLGSATRRVFGFASNLWDVFGSSCTIMSCVLFNAFLYRDKKYLIPYVAVVFMTALNSRTGLLITSLVSLVSILMYLSHRLSVRKMLTVATMPIIVLLGIYVFTQIADSSSLDWIFAAFSEVGALLFKRESSGTLSYFTSSFLIFPESIIQVIFGQGLRPRDLIGVNTDIGYIEMIWKYGVIGSLLIYSTYLSLFKQAQMWASEYMFYSLMIIPISIGFFQVKTNLIGVNSATILILIVLLMASYSFRTDTNRERQKYER